MNPLPILRNRRTNSKSNVNCCVYGCNAVNKKNPNLSFHKFPNPGEMVWQVSDFGNKNQKDRRKLWETSLKMGKKVWPHMRVCSRHFQDDDFITPNEDYYAKRFLKKSAVPSKNLPSVRSQEVVEYKLKLKEERLQRLTARRKKEEISPRSFEAMDDTPCVNADLLFTEQSAAEVLASLGSTELQCQKQYISVGTQTEVNSCKTLIPSKCDASVQVATKWTSILDYIETDKSLKILTGIPTFAMLECLAELYKLVKKDIRAHRLLIKERIVLTFLKLKPDLPYVALCVLFKEISNPTCKSIFQETVTVLAELLRIAIPFPSKEEIHKNIPACFRNFQNVRIVLDCTEIVKSICRLRKSSQLE